MAAAELLVPVVGIGAELRDLDLGIAAGLQDLRMAGERLVPEVGVVALCIVISCGEILKPLFGFLALHPADAAALVCLHMAYLDAVIILYLHVATEARAAAAPLVVLVCSVLVFAGMAFVFFLATDGGGGR